MKISNKIVNGALLLFLSTPFASMAQDQRAMTPEDLREWRKLTKTEISRDGKWVIAVNEPTHA
ncbi:MAG: hypothetical protein Q4B58_06260, partial [Bacteroidales bacterium]|nr:hypothetical protein [Bacteroidales bacterium]